MMIDVLFSGEWVILITIALMHSVTAVVNFPSLHKTATSRFLPQEHHVTKTDVIQGIGILTSKGTDHTLPSMVADMGDVSIEHNPTNIPTITGAAVSESTHHAPHPATAAPWLNLRPMDAPITIHPVTYPIIIISGGFDSDIQVFAFYHVLSSVIPTPWTHMVLDVLSFYLIWLY